jgi:hypothetical protein
MYVQADHEALIYRSEQMNKKSSISSLAEENGEGPSIIRKQLSFCHVRVAGRRGPPGVGNCESPSVMVTNSASPYSQEANDSSIGILVVLE